MSARPLIEMACVDLDSPPRPLVYQVRDGLYGWVENGLGWTLDVRGSGTWKRMDAPLCGHVLSESQVVALVATFGRPS